MGRASRLPHQTGGARRRDAREKPLLVQASPAASTRALSRRGRWAV